MTVEGNKKWKWQIPNPNSVVLIQALFVHVLELLSDCGIDERGSMITLHCEFDAVQRTVQARVERNKSNSY